MPDLARDDEVEDHDWLAQHFEDLTGELELMTPSEWAEKNRYLPPSVTSLPGFFRFEVAPYLREILDCLGADSPVREVSVMKGVQICMTTGVIENAIGYYIAHVRTAPMMLITADSELTKLRMDSYITPMLHHSELEHLIKSSDVTNTRKRGKTDKRLEWIGGGFLIPFGAQNANKLRSTSIQILLRDEVDGWPTVIGKDGKEGDPLKLSADRTAAYEGSRKIVDLSTPLIAGTSKIAQRFACGDQRRYFVCCLGCGLPQVLRWSGTGPDGEVTGIIWETERDRLVHDSVRYRCECGRQHINDDKTRLLSPENGAEWRPMAEPVSPFHRSYHINALYSPVGMQTWGACVAKWLDAWDTERVRPRDLAKLQVFYNNVLGKPFELRGEKLRFEQVSEHRRHYSFGEVPNKLATKYSGAPILLLTCAVDVHKEDLAVAVFGWAKGRRAFLIDYWRFDGDTEQIDNPATWGRLRKLIETQVYTADDGSRYRIRLTLIDSAYRTDVVYRFAARYDAGVAPIKGREAPQGVNATKEFSEFKTKAGTVGYSIVVDLYKDRWSAALRRGWDPHDLQPDGHFNAPLDVEDYQLKELTVETKRAKIEARTGTRRGYVWHRPQGAANELWDLLIYGSAALDLIAWDVCLNELGLEGVHWPTFDALCAERRIFIEPGS